MRLSIRNAAHDIGRSLFIGEATIKAHLKNIFAKLNVLSRTKAIATPLIGGWYDYSDSSRAVMTWWKDCSSSM